MGTTDLQKKIAVSSMTLGGVLKHMAYVENHWLSDWLFGREKLSPWSQVDWSKEHDWEWNSASEDSPKKLFDLWHGACDLSRSSVLPDIPGTTVGLLAMANAHRIASEAI